MGKKRTELKLGPLTIDAKVLVGLVMAIIAIVVVAVVVKPMIKKWKETKAAEEQAQQEQANAYEKRMFSVGEIVGGNYYVKDGDFFYPVARGYLMSRAENDTAIAKQADPSNRSLYFSGDDAQIPTLYSDCSLVFKAQEGESIPAEFVLERFKDNGWSVGINGLQQNQGGTLATTVTGSTFYYGSSMANIQVSEGDALILDKVDGISFGKNVLSSVGTINGLEQGRDYKIDAYVGTNYVGLNAKADVHVFISMERYVLTEYSMDPAGYLSVSFPHDMWSGYYYINGMGVFRYINQPKSMGDTIADFNTPYYTYDVNGNERINPASGSGTGIGGDSSWDITIPIEENTTIVKADVRYQGSRASGIPDAKLVAPNGGEYPLALSTTEENLLATKLEFPMAGKWKLSMNGMSNRVFDVDISFGDPISGNYEIMKDSDEDAQIILTLPELKQALITFAWDNREYAGRFYMYSNDSGDVSFGSEENPELITQETYGKVVMTPGELPAGDYTVNISGKALGNVVVYYDDLSQQEKAPEASETAADGAAGTEETAAEGTENAGESGETAAETKGAAG